MGYKKPHKYDIARSALPVRLTIFVRGSRLDPQNRETNLYLSRARHGYHVDPAVLPWSGRRAVHIYLPNLKAAVDLMLACPHLELVSDRYEGPPR